MENSTKRINMVLYLLEKGDVKTPAQKWDIIPNKLYVIGRSKKEADIALDEKLLSRKQAELIYYDNTKIMIKDLNSRNGTYINKEKIEPLKEIYFTMRDILSFGGIKNEIVFYDISEEKNNKRKYSDDDNKESKSKNYYKNDNDNDKIEKNSYSKKDDSYYKKRYNNSDYEKREKYSYNKNDKYSNRNRFSKNSSSRDRRSRSREIYREKSKHFSDRENPYKKSLRSSKDIDYHKKEYDDKLFDKYSKEIDKKIDYPKRFSMTNEEKDKGETSRYRSERNKFYDNYENEFDKNSNDVGFIKCHVNGYLVLNIRK